MRIDIDREEDGRWIGEVPDLPGVLAYGGSREEAVAKAEALALRVIADRLDLSEIGPRMLARIAKQTGIEPSDL